MRLYIAPLVFFIGIISTSELTAEEAGPTFAELIQNSPPKTLLMDMSLKGAHDTLIQNNVKEALSFAIGLQGTEQVRYYFANLILTTATVSLEEMTQLYAVIYNTECKFQRQRAVLNMRRFFVGLPRELSIEAIFEKMLASKWSISRSEFLEVAQAWDKERTGRRMRPIPLWRFQ